MSEAVVRKPQMEEFVDTTQAETKPHSDAVSGNSVHSVQDDIIEMTEDNSAATQAEEAEIRAAEKVEKIDIEPVVESVGKTEITEVTALNSVPVQQPDVSKNVDSSTSGSDATSSVSTPTASPVAEKETMEPVSAGADNEAESENITDPLAGVKTPDANEDKKEEENAYVLTVISRMRGFVDSCQNSFVETGNKNQSAEQEFNSVQAYGNSLNIPSETPEYDTMISKFEEIRNLGSELTNLRSQIVHIGGLASTNTDELMSSRINELTASMNHSQAVAISAELDAKIPVKENLDEEFDKIHVRLSNIFNEIRGMSPHVVPDPAPPAAAVPSPTSGSQSKPQGINQPNISNGQNPGQNPQQAPRQSGGGGGAVGSIVSGIGGAFRSVGNAVKTVYNSGTPEAALQRDMLAARTRDARAAFQSEQAERQFVNADTYMTNMENGHQRLSDSISKINTVIESSPAGRTFLNDMETQVQGDAHAKGITPSAARTDIWERIHNNDPSVACLKVQADALCADKDVARSMRESESALYDIRANSKAAIQSINAGLNNMPEGPTRDERVNKIKERTEALQNSDIPDAHLSKPGTEPDNRIESMKEHMQKAMEDFMEKLRQMIERVLGAIGLGRKP